MFVSSGSAAKRPIIDMRASDARGVAEKERDVRGANAGARRRQRRTEGEDMVGGNLESV